MNASPYLREALIQLNSTAGATVSVFGVPAQTEEETDDYVVQMSPAIGANLSIQDIDRSRWKEARYHCKIIHILSINVETDSTGHG